MLVINRHEAKACVMHEPVYCARWNRLFWRNSARLHRFYCCVLLRSSKNPKLSAALSVHSQSLKDGAEGSFEYKVNEYSSAWRLLEISTENTVVVCDVTLPWNDDFLHFMRLGWHCFAVAIVSRVLLVYLSREVTILSLFSPHSSSGASVVAIDNKIEQAMVSHPAFLLMNSAYLNRYFVYMPQAVCRVASAPEEWIM